MDMKAEIKNFIIENFYYGQDDNKLGDDVSFLENGIIDSTGVLELVSFVQEKFSVHVKDDELVPENFDSLNKLSVYLTRKMAVGAEQAAGQASHALS